MKSRWPLIFFLFLPLLSAAQDGALSFDIKTLRSSDGHCSIYAYVDSLYRAASPCDSPGQKESFRIEVDPSGSTVAVQALFHPGSCKSRKYAELLYGIRWKNLSFEKSRTLYLNFEDRKEPGKDGR